MTTYIPGQEVSQPKKPPLPYIYIYIYIYPAMHTPPEINESLKGFLSLFLSRTIPHSRQVREKRKRRFRAYAQHPQQQYTASSQRKLVSRARRHIFAGRPSIFVLARIAFRRAIYASGTRYARARERAGDSFFVCGSPQLAGNARECACVDMLMTRVRARSRRGTRARALASYNTTQCCMRNER